MRKVVTNRTITMMTMMRVKRRKRSRRRKRREVLAKFSQNATNPVYLLKYTETRWSFITVLLGNQNNSYRWSRWPRVTRRSRITLNKQHHSALEKTTTLTQHDYQWKCHFSDKFSWLATLPARKLHRQVLCVFSDKTVIKEDTYGFLVTESKHLVKHLVCLQTCKTIAYFLSKTHFIGKVLI